MTEKKLWTLNVDEEFKALIPPLTDEERRMLEDSILKNGCEMPILVWDGTIIDGHNRYDICQRHSIPFATEERTFDSRRDAEMWMLRNRSIGGVSMAQTQMQLIDPSKNVLGWIDSGGGFHSAAGYWCTEFIPVNPEETLPFTMSNPTQATVWYDDTFFDANKGFLEPVQLFL